MSFRIKHETTWMKIVSTASCLLFFGVIMKFCLITESFGKPPAWLIAVFVLLLILLAAASALYFIEQAVGTRIAVDSETITVRYLFGKRRIAPDSIRDVQMERYQRVRRKKHSIVCKSGGYHFLEHRLRMTVHMLNERDLVLTDTAMTETGGIFGSLFSTMEPLPDEVVPLYQAYRSILSMLNRTPAN